jgi:uncharacterized membrane protein YesL
MTSTIGDVPLHEYVMDFYREGFINGLLAGLLFVGLVVVCVVGVAMTETREVSS